jgi:hypothetical protein
MRLTPGRLLAFAGGAADSGVRCSSKASSSGANSSAGPVPGWRAANSATAARKTHSSRAASRRAAEMIPIS